MDIGAIYLGLEVLAWYLDPNGNQNKKKILSNTHTLLVLENVKSPFLGARMTSNKDNTRPTLVTTGILHTWMIYTQIHLKLH